MPNGILLTLENVAHKLSISYNQARKLVLFQKAMPYVKVGARGIRVKEEELDKYIASLERKEEVTGETVDTREAYEGRGVLSVRPIKAEEENV